MPNVAAVIPAMDYINKVLTASSGISSNYSLAIRAALTLGKRTLDKYCNKTEESKVYRIAMGMSLSSTYIILILTTMRDPVLHPCHKLEYFKRNNWDDKSIQAARAIVQDEFDRTYWSMNGEDSTQADWNVTVSCASADTWTLVTLHADLCAPQASKHV